MTSFAYFYLPFERDFSKFRINNREQSREIESKNGAEPRTLHTGHRHGKELRTDSKNRKPLLLCFLLLLPGCCPSDMGCCAIKVIINRIRFHNDAAI